MSKEVLCRCKKPMKQAGPLRLATLEPEAIFTCSSCKDTKLEFRIVGKAEPMELWVKDKPKDELLSSYVERMLRANDSR